jgi:hypothetical protein
MGQGALDAPGGTAAPIVGQQVRPPRHAAVVTILVRERRSDVTLRIAALTPKEIEAAAGGRVQGRAVTGKVTIVQRVACLDRADIRRLRECLLTYRSDRASATTCSTLHSNRSGSRGLWLVRVENAQAQESRCF